VTVELAWRGPVTNAELNALHAEGFGHPLLDEDWEDQLARHSLGWVVARGGDRLLVGFVNVAWDGGAHALLLDVVVAAGHRGRGVGKALVQAAAEGAAGAGCEWLHADWETDLDPFYKGACGFTPTSAGLRALRE
jgi:GNAT superfamily N-acetyltransferase